jgi:two-component system sensor kinase FixL
MGTMASALAHELNQPLAAICNYTRATRRILEGKDADASQLAVEGIEQAEEAAHRAGEIVRRIRSFVSGDGTPRKPEDLTAIVEEACAFGLAEARAHGVRQEIRIAPNEYEVLVDRIQIQQVLINLLQNAVDALKSTPMPRIIVTARAENGCAIVTADNGAGVSELAQKTLFEPFSTTKNNGMGMGLAICRTIIEAHEGRLGWAVSPENETQFSFSIPLVPHAE